MRLFGRKSQESESREQAAPMPDKPPLPFVKKMLVVVDGSQPALDAVDYAIALATRVSCELIAAFVIDTAIMDYLLQMRILVKDEREDFELDLEKKGRHALAQVRSLGLVHGLEIETLLCKGRLHQTILQTARELQIDTIVIGGWHEGTTLKDSSSVERQLVLDQAECPVIVIKTPDANHH